MTASIKGFRDIIASKVNPMTRPILNKFSRQSSSEVQKFEGKIPCISQIFITDSGSKSLPPALEKAVAAVHTHFPESPHKIYGGEELRSFIADHLGTEVVEAFDSLRAYAAKADLGRYCLLHVLGGWYFDIAIEPLTHHKPSPSTQLLAFADIQRHSRTCWSCATSLLYAHPDIKVFEVAISMILRNCREKYYGLTPLCPTGPTLLGEALASLRAQDAYVFGEFVELTPYRSIKNHAFVLPDGKILAWGKRSQGGDLAALGAKGVNNYNKLWRNRTYYK